MDYKIITAKTYDGFEMKIKKPISKKIDPKKVLEGDRYRLVLAMDTMFSMFLNHKFNIHPYQDLRKKSKNNFSSIDIILYGDFVKLVELYKEYKE